LPEQLSQSSRIDERLVQDFLLASRFEGTPSGHFPRLTKFAAKTWWRLARHVGDLVFERGVDTAGRGYDIPHFHPDRVGYQASGWSYLRRVLPRREVDANDVFVDIGSGKGRVLLQAACSYRFARVIGVEISESLNQIARTNVERRRGRLRTDVEIVTADAAEYEIPDDVTVVYLCYPFVGDTFRGMVNNLVSSVRRNPRRLRLIYALPRMEEELVRTGVFRLVRSVRIVDTGVPNRITMYEAQPA
jgi:SAM-dependent methyltransferase